MTLSQDQMTATLIAWHSQTMAYDFRRATLWHWLARHVPPHARTLDAGCGTGYMLVKLAAQGNPAVGADFDATLVTFAQNLMQEKNWTVPVHHAGLGEGKLAALGQFDRILCLDVIEHIQDDVAALAELRDSLAPGGQLLLSVPALPGLYGVRDKNIGHYRRYDKTMLHAAAAQAGLSITTLRYWNMTGVFPYLIYEKILHQPINDELRQSTRQTPLKQIVRGILTGVLTLEGYLPLPFGLTLLAVLRRQS
jgi:2-polyprenyl-3-methyl-5-hydroxy-6-metoxy-1,4-benzoquinol methylase